jgi:hypothetical protein
MKQILVYLCGIIVALCGLLGIIGIICSKRTDRLVDFLLVRRRLLAGIQVLMLIAALISLVHFSLTDFIELVLKKIPHTSDFAYNAVIVLLMLMQILWICYFTLPPLIWGLYVFKPLQTEDFLVALKPRALISLSMALIGLSLITFASYFQYGR